jgi:hypothetical protein
MSVSGFTIAHDPEVQQYNRMRAAFLAVKKQRKLEEKLQQQEQQQEHLHKVANGRSGRGQNMDGGPRKVGAWDWLRSVGRKERDEARQVMAAREALKRERDMEKRLQLDGGAKEIEVEEWSDAETEVELLDALRDGGELKAMKRQQVPPYVFLQSMAGVTNPLGRR